MSSHNNFLLVTPDGWTELENAPEILFSQGGLATVSDLINNTDWPALSQLLENAGVIAENTQITEARVINTQIGETAYRFWYIQ
jgi:hypothetical protein